MEKVRTTQEHKTIFRKNIQGIVISASQDNRERLAVYTEGNKGRVYKKFPVIIRVAHNGKRIQKMTGYHLTEDEYAKVLKGEGDSDNARIKSDIENMCEKVTETVRNILKELESGESFTLSLISLARNKEEDNRTLAEHWNLFRESRKKTKTQDMDLQAMRSFFLANGASYHIDSNGKKMLFGRVMNMRPQEVNDKVIDTWQHYMADKGNSNNTRSMYLRAFRALLNNLKADDIIKNVPKIEIPKSTRRTDNFLTVPDILKLKEYEGVDKISADWFIILYLCNGANLRDIASLRWGNDFDNELTFIRAKTEDKSPSLVHIPITPLLEPYLKKYGSPRKKGDIIFPQVLLDAKSERSITNRVHDFNADIRSGLQNICPELNIPTASASWARNSYITTLTWHGVSDTFIDDMVGHTDGKVLTGYQGRISPKKRNRINSLLFTDPESEEE